MPKVPVPNLNLDYDEQLSCRNFTNWSFNPREGYDFSTKVIYASVFSQDNPDTKIFPDNMTGATFVNCNLDNVVIPDGNTVIMEGGGRQVRQKIQNDDNHWEVDEQNKPIRPVDHKQFTKRGLPMPKPQDIPAQKVEKRVDLYEVAAQLAAVNNEDPE